MLWPRHPFNSYRSSMFWLLQLLLGVAVAFRPGNPIQEPVLAIDLGTTQSKAAIYRLPLGKVEIIPTSQIPSCVAFTEGATLIGNKAAKQAVLNPEVCL